MPLQDIIHVKISSSTYRIARCVRESQAVDLAQRDARMTRSWKDYLVILNVALDVHLDVHLDAKVLA